MFSPVQIVFQLIYMVYVTHSDKASEVAGHVEEVEVDLDESVWLGHQVDTADGRIIAGRLIIIVTSFCSHEHAVWNRETLDIIDMQLSYPVGSSEVLHD